MTLNFILENWYIILAFVAAGFVAGIAVYHGCVIQFVSNPNVFSPSTYVNLGWISVPLTIVWIVALTNAVNFIDGLDGLAVGVSAISTGSLLVIFVVQGAFSLGLSLGIGLHLGISTHIVIHTILIDYPTMHIGQEVPPRCIVIDVEAGQDVAYRHILPLEIYIEQSCLLEFV